MKLIILSITQYKEKDGIITAISENETVTFKVNRLLDPKSSGHILNTPLIEADVTFSENNHKYQTFKNGGVSFSPYSASILYENVGLTIISSSADLMKYGSIADACSS